jgi:hypothetical protein
MSELKNCPFCGSQPISEVVSGGQGLMIECLAAGCVRPHVSFIPPRFAVAAWNTRAPDPALAARDAQPHPLTDVATYDAQGRALAYDGKGDPTFIELADARVIATDLIAANARIAALEAGLRECANDLVAYVNVEYPISLRDEYPEIYERQYVREMEPVVRARALLDGGKA